MGCRDDLKGLSTSSEFFVRFLGDSFVQNGHQVIEAPDGNLFIIATLTETNGNSSMVLAKTADNGDQKWIKKFPALDSNFTTKGASLAFSPDGNVVLLGTSTKLEQDSSSILIIKVDNEGDLIWRAEHYIEDVAEPSNLLNTASHIHTLEDGSGYLITGYKGLTIEDEHRVFIARTTLEGKINNDQESWSFVKPHKGPFEEIANVLEQPSGLNNQYVFVGTSSQLYSSNIQQSGLNAIVFIHYPNNTPGPQRTFGGEGVDFGYDITKTRDGDFLVLGQTASVEHKVFKESDDNDVFIVKLPRNNPTDDPIDGNYYVFGDSGDDQGSSFAVTEDNSVIICGKTTSVDAELKEDIMLMKLNENLDTSWEEMKHWGGDFNDGANSIIESIDGGYIFAGTSSVDQNEMIGLIKTNLNGELK